MNYFDVLTRFLGFRITKYGPKPHIDFIKNKYKNKELIGAEIGVWMAENSVQIFKNLNIKKLYLIDPWGEDLNYNEKDKLNKSKFAYNISMFRLNKYKNKFHVIRKTSDNAINDIKEKLDFVYIDGNHTYDYVKKDLENYWKLLKKGGVLAGHDVNFEGVFKAVYEFSIKIKQIPKILSYDYVFIKE